MEKPKGRSDGLIVETVDDGLFVIDDENKSAHYLQRVVAWVWRRANGERSADQIAADMRTELGQESAPELVQLSLDALDRAKLLQAGPAQQRLDGMSRRSLMAAAGITAAALLTTISLPAQAQVTSNEEG